MKLIKLVLLVGVFLSACKGEEQARKKDDSDQDSSAGTEAGTMGGAPMIDLGATDLYVEPCDCADSDRQIVCECYDAEMAMEMEEDGMTGGRG